MIGFFIALLSGAMMSIQGVFNTQVTKTTGVWVSNGWVQITAFAVCLACLSSCQEEMLTGNGEKGNVKILARMTDDMPTKTCVGNVMSDGAIGILWMPGDSIGVYGDDGTKNALFTSTNTGKVAEAVFAGKITVMRNVHV